MRLTPYDYLLFRRSLWLALWLILLIAVVVSLTDEPGSSWTDRAARISALTPVVGALAVVILRAQAERRTELRTLALVGIAPWRTMWGASVGSVVPGLVAGTWIGLSSGTLRSLFPRGGVAGFVWQSGKLSIPEHGVVWDNVRQRLLPITIQTVNEPTWPRTSVAIWIACSSVILSFWVSLNASRFRKFTILGMTVVLTLVVFHLVAAGKNTGWLFLPLVPLIADGVVVIAKPGYPN
jgi:hypothetical protein